MVKVISLSNEAYEKLRALKGSRSFSEIVIEFTDCGKKTDIMDFAGAFKENSSNWNEIKKKIYEGRKKFRLREVKF
ncbi:hypothetical protein J4229_02960 [Candidatus Pacearchaeota archaeon]|nr:hypothetical protein [Candidatus Pacearchaeota archaeon]